MMASPNPQWFAIRTRSRCEKVVRAQLAGRGIEAFLPLLRRSSRWKDRTKLIEWPLFPGYCFAKFTRDQQRIVLQAPGVIQVIGSATTAEPIPEEEILSLQRVTQHGAEYENWPYELEEGTMVTVVRGPLQGVHGKFVRRGSGGRLILAVHLIQQAAAVTIAAEDVIRMDDDHRPEESDSSTR